MKYAYFKNFDKIPLLGLGTWKSRPGEVKQAIKTAIDSGIRHFDCAKIYGNEIEIGEAFKSVFDEGKIERKDVFITSKLWNNAHLSDDVFPAIHKTLDDLQLDYLDLYLIHWPVATKPDVVNPKVAEDYISLDNAPLLDTWKKMIEIKQLGLAKHIGVANFSIPNLKLLMAGSALIPEMNQVEAHPYLNQAELLKFCKQNDILFTAYSPLGSRDKSNPEKLDLFEDKTVVALAEKNNCSSAQLLLAWGMQRETIVIPKTVTPSRMAENLASEGIQLDDIDMEKLDALDRAHRFIDGSFWTVEGNSYSLSDLWGN